MRVLASPRDPGSRGASSPEAEIGSLCLPRDPWPFPQQPSENYLEALRSAVRGGQVQAFLAGVQAINDFLALQLPRADGQASQVAAEELGHPLVTPWARKEKQPYLAQVLD